MPLFSVSDTELAILKKYLARLELIDLSTGKYSDLFEPDSREAGSEEVYLTPKFAIGRYRLRPQSTSAAPSAGDVIANMLVLQYERSWTAHMMAALTQPVPLDVTDNAYNHSVASLIADATVCRTAILRAIDVGDEKDGKISEFRCLAVYDHANTLSDGIEILHLSPNDPAKSYDLYMGYVARLKNDPESVLVLHPDSEPDLYEVLRNRLGEPDVQTVIVAPLSLAGKLNGLLTCLYNFRVDLSPSLHLAFLSVANHANAAVENFRSLSELRGLRISELRDYIENRHLELMHGFRHVARNALFAANGDARVLKRLYHHEGDLKTNPVVLLERHLLNIDFALRSMESLRQFDSSKELCSVVELFNDACTLMQMQLEEHKVEIRQQNVRGSMTMELNRQAVRTAFANLILNSVQAFAEGRKSGDRHITFSAIRTGREIAIEFADNGPGIRLGVRGIRTYDDIWIPGKTSKERGTGYGLPFVREVFQRLHNGSVDLFKSSSHGTVFRIKLREKAV